MKKFLIRMLKGILGVTIFGATFLVMYGLMKLVGEWFILTIMCGFVAYFVGGIFTDLEDEE